jgi:hypothetical protein
MQEGLAVSNTGDLQQVVGVNTVLIHRATGAQIFIFADKGGDLIGKIITPGKSQSLATGEVLDVPKSGVSSLYDIKHPSGDELASYHALLSHDPMNPQQTQDLINSDPMSTGLNEIKMKVELAAMKRGMNLLKENVAATNNLQPVQFYKLIELLESDIEALDYDDWNFYAHETGLDVDTLVNMYQAYGFNVKRYEATTQMKDVYCKQHNMTWEQIRQQAEEAAIDPIPDYGDEELQEQFKQMNEVAKKLGVNNFIK